ncbi:uncharacterized protein At2g34460, chloroplastic-like isoform X2 [Lycium ferocissimum]|uniref:uncharacterized protein At2g34460, chloroplastic-like isoform X2 n=1 Tax=Lycium ferocissimum TaxID=112874 RepID=UPI002814B4BD|nr:uncharacterized protein At2g34460, chloroplastic-like isoform X2 [Lycium ferocissimum]
MEGSEIKEEKEAGISEKKKIFVAGATGNTGKRIVEQLLAKGFAVKAGVRDVDKAKSILPEANPLLQFVDNIGTVNLVDACQKLGINRFILISSILVNGAAMGQWFNPVYIILNAMGLVLVAKLQAEKYIRKSGINYTIIRPGGLKNDPPQGNIIMQPEDTLFRGSISRDQVAEVAVEALLHPESHHKVVEIVASTDVPKRSFEELFGSIELQ